MARWLTLLILIVAAATSLATWIPAAKTAQINRDLLWATIQVCVAGKRAANIALPCAAVDLGAPDRPGFAILQVPGEKTHFVLSPVADIVGLESPRLLENDGALLFKAAVDARNRVVAAADHRVVLADVGIAVNSASGRSQDHLHLHLQCVAPAARAVIDSEEDIGSAWKLLSKPIKGRRYLARRISEEDIGVLNPFAALLEALPDPSMIRDASLAFIPESGAKSYYLLVNVRPRSLAEKLLDHQCRMAAAD